MIAAWQVRSWAWNQASRVAAADEGPRGSDDTVDGFSVDMDGSHQAPAMNRLTKVSSVARAEVANRLSNRASLAPTRLVA